MRHFYFIALATSTALLITVAFPYQQELFESIVQNPRQFMGAVVAGSFGAGMMIGRLFDPLWNLREQWFER